MAPTRTLAGLGIVLATALASALLAPELPERMATHWSASGTADGSLDRTTVLVGGPALVLGTVALFEALPRIDPLGSNVHEFQSAYDTVAVLTAGFLAYTHGLVIAWNLGSGFDMTVALAPAMAVLYAGIGVLVGRAERNWFVGVRTPWTLSSERVWRDTHNLSAGLFKLTGVLALGAVLFPGFAIYFLVVPVTVASLVATGYSYVRYRQLGESGVDGAGR